MLAGYHRERMLPCMHSAFCHFFVAQSGSHMYRGDVVDSFIPNSYHMHRYWNEHNAAYNILLLVIIH